MAAFFQCLNIAPEGLGLNFREVQVPVEPLSWQLHIRPGTAPSAGSAPRRGDRLWGDLAGISGAQNLVAEASRLEEYSEDMAGFRARPAIVVQASSAGRVSSKPEM